MSSYFHRRVLISLGATALVFFFVILLPKPTPALSADGLKTATTFYGGYFDENRKVWVIDNTNECNRIKKGEFTAESMQAVVSQNCSDDNGLGYVEGIKLHNTVSFAELSNDYQNPDYSALGNLPAHTKIKIEYNGKCLIAEKLDVGDGGPGMNGYERGLDLWWQTARAINFTNGFDITKIYAVPQNTPLTPLGQTSNCTTNQATGAQPAGTTTPSKAKISSKNKPVISKTTKPRTQGKVLGASDEASATAPALYSRYLPLWIAGWVALTASVVIFSLRRHRT